MKFSIKDLVALTEEILNGKFSFSRGVSVECNLRIKLP